MSYNSAATCVCRLEIISHFEKIRSGVRHRSYSLKGCEGNEDSADPGVEGVEIGPVNALFDHSWTMAGDEAARELQINRTIYISTWTIQRWCGPGIRF